MESDQGKLFIGGISWETDENILREYFSNFGEVLQVTVMRDKATGRPRGFGFVAFSDPAVIDRVLQDKHHIDNRDVDVKRAMSRDEQSPAGRQGGFNGNRSFDSGANVRTKKIFVGGLPPALTSDEFRAYFETYGPVSDAVIMIDQATQRPRGFGFVSFDSEDSVDLVLHKSYHDLSGKQVEVKRALPKDANPGVAGGGSRGGGGFPGYGGSGGSGYEGRVDSSRYMPPQNAGSGGYPPYGGASGYGTGYGYGSSGAGYGGFGGGGYGNPSGAPYGNPGGPGAGFGSGPRPSWEGQAPSGYGNNVGYGNAAAAPWGGSGPGSVGIGQGGAAAGYGSQGYGYGGNDSSYGTQSGYGAVGGRPNSHGGGYADVSDGSGGYGNHQVNGQAGYGGGYGRQAQQQ
ncbi:heterogeneous nuclear ribonucleoprotein 1 [Brassica rapa]|uniref:RRM domain-containing protein n=1 Tax=Brassica campestris TaxID=3711 RepID=A0A3P5ZC14_BRACM|nr:heterogeneous nuclear ribonucleoprotein 1 [Brassica rapa]CAG7874718.1 unnamed protein product [Brassica rapa]VDC70440.1 unnamed protein product [Brassica rapa]